LKPEQKILCSCDWLGLSLRLSGEVKPIEGYVWREYSATNVWNKRRILYTEDGDKVLTLLNEPRSAIIAKNAALLEIENEWLYHGGGYWRILDTLRSSVFFEVIGISRLDLCVDFVPTKSQSATIDNLYNGKYYVVGKRNGSNFWSRNKNPKLQADWLNREIPHNQSWGHKTSAIKWKLYYKSKELLDAMGGKFYDKPYIVDMWRINGLDTSNVWRLEVSLKHLNDYSIYGHPITLDWLDSNQLELFCQMYNQRFQIRKNQGHLDRSNDDEVEFLPIPKIVRTFQRNDPKTKRQHNGRITLLRHLIQSLDDEQVLLDDVSRNAVFDHISSILNRDNLHNYFLAITGQWFDEWVATKDEQAAGTQVIDIPRPQTNADILPNENADTYNPDTEKRYWESVGAKVKRDIGLNFQ
jgi:hypothetical protein